MDGRSIVWKGLGEVGGSSKKKGRLPNPYRSVHGTAPHTALISPKPIVVHSHSHYWVQTGPAAERWTTAPHLSTSPNEFIVGRGGQSGQ